MKNHRPFKSLFNLIIIGTSFLIPCQDCIGQSHGQIASPNQEKEIQHRYGLDPSKPLIARVGEASADVLKTFRDAGMSPRKHILTEQERTIVNRAFGGLTPLHKRVLLAHLRSISFLDDMPNTALTSTINPKDPFPLFDITFRAGILKQNLSEWITEKERTCFNTTGSNISVSIEAGTLDAITYVLLHETTHVVDGSLEITPGKNSGIVPLNSFVTGVWVDRTTIAPAFHEHFLDSTRFRRAKVLSIKLADSVYTALEHTPFVSLYSTSSWHEDLAEFVSVYNFTKLKKQPFRIVLHDANKEIFSYEPMKSKLVRKRIRFVKRFYADA
ncbi:MAG TPA: hypothetical protein VK609_19750 [Mucilaginibacter sp.]|nr:hypothetical protein [Mucilaginibacter sp.]